MAKLIELPNGEIAEFPDGMADSEIEAALGSSSFGGKPTRVPQDRNLNRQIAVGAIGRPSGIDYMTPDNLGSLPELLRKREAWEQPVLSRYPAKTRSGGRGTNMPPLGSINNPYPSKNALSEEGVPTPIPDGAYYKGKGGQTLQYTMGNLESLGNLGKRVVNDAVASYRSLAPSLESMSATDRLTEIEQNGGYYTIGDAENKMRMKASPEYVAALHKERNKEIVELGRIDKSKALANAQAPKSADQIAFDQEFNESDKDAGYLGNLGRAAKVAIKNPLDFAATATQSLGGSVPAIALSALTRNPSFLFAINSATGYQQEMSAGILDYMAKNNIPLDSIETLPNSVVQEAVDYARSNATIIGLGSGIMGTVASKALVPARFAATPAKAVLANSGAQAVAGGVGDFGFETLKQAAGGQGLSPEEALMELGGGFVSQPVEATQATIQAARLRGQTFDKPQVQPEAQPQPEITPEALGAIGQAIEAKADAKVQEQAQVQRTFEEAGSVIDNTLSELEAATKPRLDKAEAKALQAELQDINAVLKEQEQYERENVLRSPENNVSAQDKQAYGKRQAEIKAKLEAHRAAGSAESQLRELQSKLSKIDNDNDLLALANSLSAPAQGLGDIGLTQPVQSQPVQTQPAQESLGDLGAISQAVEKAVGDNPEILAYLDNVLEELGGITVPNAQTPEPDEGLTAALEALPKPAPLIEESGTLSPPTIPSAESANAPKFSNTKGVKDEIYRSGIARNTQATSTQRSEELNAELRKTIQEQNVLDQAGKPINPSDVAFEEVGKDGLHDSVLDVAEQFSKLGNVEVVVISDKNSKQKLWFDGVLSTKNKIYVAADAVSPFAGIIGHEFTHKMRKDDPDLYNRLAKFIVDEDWKGHADAYGYSANKKMSDDKKVEELVANAVADAVTDKGFIKKLADKAPDLFKDFAQAMVKHLDAILKVFGKVQNQGSNKFIKDATAFRNELLEVLVEVAKRNRDRAKMSANNGVQNEQTTTSAGTQKLPESRRVRGSDGILAESRRPYQRDGRKGKSLEGLPTQISVDGEQVEFQAFAPAQKAAEQYMADAGLAYSPPTSYAKVDPVRAERIADAFEQMAHNPADPEVQAAYKAMIDETVAQYRAILKTGLKVEFIKGADPYGNPRNAILDIVENNHFWVYSTRDGFGSNDEFDPIDNPLLANTEFVISGEVALANDIFRVVHDYFGHVKEGVGFRADGEENAWRAHSAMYSPDARRAMTTETRGQNSWVNYGKHGEYNRKASPDKTIYADQKIGLLPPWVSEDGAQFARKKGTIANDSETENSDGQSGLRQTPPRSGSKVAGKQSAQEAKVAPWLPLPAIKKPELVPTFNQSQPQEEAVTAYGVHYSGATGLTELDSKFAGSGSAGAERRRFGMANYGAQAPDGSTARRLYFYAQDSVTPPVKEAVVSGNSMYRVRLENLYDAEEDSLGIAAANRINPDAFEEEVVDAGFDGVLYPPVGSGIDVPTIVLFGLKDKVPVQRSGDDPSFSRRKQVESSNDWTFSPLARMVEGAPLKQVAADQWKKWIAANATKMGVKADELEYTGINDWLDMQEGKVSKEAIATYLDAGGVQVVDVVKREDGEIDENSIADYIERYVADEASGFEDGSVYRYENGVIDVMEGDDVVHSGVPSLVAEEIGLDPEDIGADAEVVKFAEYTVAGGDKGSYREVLLTLPNKLVNYGEQESALRAKLNDDLTEDKRDEIYDKIDAIAKKRNAQGKKPLFTSSHWDEKNIVAHTRFDTRKDADGNPVLFIHEIQSDWGQTGRKDGFKAPVYKEKRDDGWYVVNTATGREGLVDSEGAADSFIQSMQKSFAPTPSAPFVTDTKAWVTLALKRMIRFAVDSGIDRIALINGEQAADLYDLSKRIERVVYWKNKDNTYGVYAYGVEGGQKILSKQRAKESELEGIIGKELAKKIIDTAPTQGDKTLSGLDLKVGGEGMKAFYDKLVPQVANEVLRKLGGGKVQRMTLPSGEQSVLDIPQAMRDKFAEGEVPLFARRQMLEDGVPRESDPIVSDNDQAPLSIDKKPIRFAFGKQKASHSGFGMKHIIEEVGKAKRIRTPPKVGRDLAEDLVQQARDILLNADQRYSDRNKIQLVDSNTGRAVTLQNWEDPTTREKYWSVITILPKSYVDNNKKERGWTLEYTKGTDQSDKQFPVLSDKGRLSANSARDNSPARVSVPFNYNPNSVQFARKYAGTAGWNYDTNTWEGTKGTLKKAREALQDKMLAWRDVQKAIEDGVGSPLPDAQNVYRLENLMHGKVSDGMKALEEKHWMPIDREMNRLGIKPDDLQKYLIARHAPERNARIASINPQMPDGGSGMDTADANQYMTGLDPAQKAKLSKVAALVDALIKDTLTRQFNSGLIDQETYTILTSMYKHYVPLRGTDDEYASSGTGTGQGLDGRGKLIKNALGRGSGNEAKNVLGEVIGDSQRALVSAEKARVGRALMRLILANPSSLWQIEPVQTKRYIDANGEVAEKVVQDWSDPSVIAVKHNGKLYKVEINDPRLMSGLKNLGVAHLNGFLTVTAKVNRYFSSVLTQYNPAFIPVNATRDMIFGLTGMAVEHGTLAAARAAKNYPMAALAAYQYARGKRGTGKHDAWAQEFAKAGGKTGYVHMESVEELQNKLGSGKFGSFDPQGIRKLAVGLADAVSNINDGVENALRLSAYMTLREQGMSVDKAAEYAKNLTVNFNRKGTNGTQINALLLFFNASVQGAARSLKLMKNPKTYGYLGTMAALQTVAALFAMGLKEDDDDDSLWDKIPDHVKRRNIVIPLNASHYMTIPMPYGMNVFTYSASKMVDALTNKGQRPEESILTATADVMNAAVESFSPVPLDEGVWGLLPQIIRPAANIARNKDGLGIPIRKENPYDRADAPLSSVGKPDTMEIFKVTATGLNRLGGGDDYKAPAFAMFDRAPEDIEYILKELGGGAGKFVLDVASLGEKAYSGAELSLRDIPIAKRFVTEVDPVVSQQALYYARTQAIVRAENQLKDIFKDEGKSAAEYFIGRTPELTGARIVGVTSTGNPKLKAVGGDTVYAQYKATEKAIEDRNDSYRYEYKQAPASLIPSKEGAARDKKIRELNTERAEQQKQFNKAWHRDVVSIAE